MFIARDQGLGAQLPGNSKWSGLVEGMQASSKQLPFEHRTGAQFTNHSFPCAQCHFPIHATNQAAIIQQQQLNTEVFEPPHRQRQEQQQQQQQQQPPLAPLQAAAAALLCAAPLESSMSLEQYTEFFHILTKGSGSVQVLSDIEKPMLKMGDLKEVGHELPSSQALPPTIAIHSGRSANPPQLCAVGHMCRSC
jgi:hypothetical protein